MKKELESKSSRFTDTLKYLWNGLGVWLICIIIFILLAVSTKTFLSSNNLINVVRQVAVTGIVALGATFVVLSGEIDLSQGSVVALIGCICAKLIVESGMSVALSIVISLVIGCLIMTVIGVIISVAGVPSFIATLGLQYVILGVVLLLTNSIPIIGLPDSFTYIARGYIGGIPLSAIILFVVFILGAFALKYFPFGRNVIVVGENPLVAELSGIRVTMTKILVYSLAGVTSSLGGIVLASRLGSGQPSSGTDVSLMALAAVFIGSASKGGVMSTLAGTLIIGMISNGLNLLGVAAAWKNVALGSIIITAVALDVAKSRRAKRDMS